MRYPGLILCAIVILSCSRSKPVEDTSPGGKSNQAFLDSLSHRTFNFFWDQADPTTGNQPDRWPTESFSSIAATGFGLTTYLVGVERGYITRKQAAARVVTTLKFFKNAPTGGGKSG